MLEPTEGRIVEIATHRRFSLAFCIESRDNLRVLTPEGDECNIVAKQVLYVFDAEVRAEHRSAKINALLDIIDRAAYVRGQVDAEDVRLLFESGDRVDPETVADILFHDRSPGNVYGIILALREDAICFKWRKEGYFEAIDEASMKTARSLKHFEENRLEIIRAFAQDSALSVRRGDGKALRKLVDSRPEYALILDTMQAYALFGESHPSKQAAQQALKAIEASSGMGFGGTGSQKLCDFMRQVSLWDKHTPIFALRHDLKLDFDEKSLNEAKNIAQNYRHAQADREDFRSLDLLAVDDAGTLDIDDALSLEMLPDGGRRLGVHIAAVACGAIDWHGEIRRSAQEKGATLYLPDRNYPMLPRELTESVFSLHEGQDRCALSFFVDFDADLNEVSARIARTLVCVKRQMSYEEADMMMESGNSRVAQTLRDLQMITDMLRQSRFDDGAPELEIREMRIRVDDYERISIHEYDNTAMSRGIVSEAMILANRVAAEFCAEHQLPVLYRCQEKPVDFPDEQYLSAISSEILRSIEKRKKLMPAKASTTPYPHYGLALRRYTQITSPLRRFCDFFAHFRIEEWLQGKDCAEKREDCATMLFAAEDRAKEVKAASAETLNYWLLLYYRQEQHREHRATVIQYLAEKSNLARVYLHNTHFLTQVTTPKRFAPGSEILLAVDNVHPDENSVTFVFRSG